jgi:hypothetical protein
VTPPLFEAIDEGTATGSAAAGPADGGATGNAQLRMASPAEGLQTQSRGNQHEHEAAHAQRNVLASNTEYQYGKAQQYGYGRKNDPPTRVEARIGGTNRRGKLRVLGQRPLDLIEQALLVFGQRHCPSPAIAADPDRAGGPHAAG